MRPNVMLADGQLGDLMACVNHPAGAVEYVPSVRAAAGDMCDAL